MAIQIWRGSCVVSSWNCSAVSRQNTACGTLVATIARLSNSDPCASGRRYRPRPTLSRTPAAVRRVRTTRGASMASRSLARSNPFWVARSRTRWVWVSASMVGVCSVYSFNAISRRKTGTVSCSRVWFPVLETEPQTVAARTSGEVCGGARFPPDFRMMYKHSHGIPASTAGRVNGGQEAHLFCGEVAVFASGWTAPEVSALICGACAATTDQQDSSNKQSANF